MSKITDAIELAKRWAADPAHGYDQNNRWGPDYDCSSFLISVWESVGVPVRSNGATYTGNMYSVFTRCGFADVTGQELQPGDILLNDAYHTEMYIGSNQVVGAAGNELGGITGGKTGDQTGGEIRVRSYYVYSYGWTHVLRYAGDDPSTASGPPPLSGEAEKNEYVVQPGDGWWRIAREQWGDGSLMYELARLNGKTVETMLHPGDVVRLRGEKDNVAAERARLELEAARYGGTITWR